MKRYCDELAGLRAGEAGKKALVELLMAHEVGQTQTGPRPRRPMFRTALIAAAVAALLVAGALAANLGVWQRFFRGDGGDAVTPVDVSATTGDYTLTLAESIVNEDEATFLLALTRTDGGVLEGRPSLSGNVLHWDVKVNGERSNRMMTQQDPIRSADGKAVYYCLEFRDERLEREESLVGSEITFVCNGVADMDWTEEEEANIRMETVSLAPMAQAAPTVDQGWEDLVTGVEKRFENLSRLVEDMAGCQIPLALGDGQAACVSGVIFTADGPAVAVSWLTDRCRQNDYLAVEGVPYRLTDTRTGESWSMNGFVRGGHSSKTYLSRFSDCPLTAEDLPYLELTVRYQMDKVLSDEPAELSFYAQKGGGVTKELDQMVDYDDFYCEGRVDRARISALGIRLYMVDIGRAGSFNLKGRLVMKDGTQWTIRSGGIYLDTEAGHGYVELRPQDAQGNRILIDPQAVRTLVLGDCEIDLAV